MTRVKISDRCQGHGRCALIAPGLFDVDESGMGQVLVETVPEDESALAGEAALSCPEQAIELDG